MWQEVCSGANWNVYFSNFIIDMFFALVSRNFAKPSKIEKCYRVPPAKNIAFIIFQDKYFALKNVCDWNFYQRPCRKNAAKLENWWEFLCSKYPKSRRIFKSKKNCHPANSKDHEWPWFRLFLPMMVPQTAQFGIAATYRRNKWSQRYNFYIFPNKLNEKIQKKFKSVIADEIRRGIATWIVSILFFLFINLLIPPLFNLINALS